MSSWCAPDATVLQLSWNDRVSFPLRTRVVAEELSALLVGRDERGARQGVEEQVEPEDGGRGVRGDVEGVGVDGVHDDEVPVRTVPGRWRGTHVAGETAVVAQLDRPPGQ